MTIGIAAAGPWAGQAVFRALQCAEAVGTLSIGGFCSYAALLRDGRIVRYWTQRGGTATLVTDGEVCGVPLPPAVQRAERAALIASGPDRPEPLTDSLPARPAVGLVTGHRFPRAPGRSGRAINVEVLELMAEGLDAQAAADTIVGENEEVDVGIVALDAAGRIGLRNSRKVLRRPDVAECRRSDPVTGATIQVVLNAIHPPNAVAVVAVETGLMVMTGERRPDLRVRLRVGTPLVAGRRDQIEVNARNLVTRVITTDASLLKGERIGIAPYLGSEVRCAGRRLGFTITECLTVIQDGIIQDLAGQREVRLDVQAR